jgi:RNA polymerase sigma factor (sigma-70 family)
MGAPPPPEPSGPFQDVHRRLMERDPTAPADLASALLEPLIHWLAETNPRVDPDLLCEAADEAVLALIHHPSSYKPEKGLALERYLRMSAQGDLRNLLRRDRPHQKRVPWEVVELSEEHGNYLGQEDDPSLPLVLEEERQRLQAVIPGSVREGLSEGELRALDLLQQQERRTAAYAEALGITERPTEEQKKIVKQVKDKLSKRLERAKGEP